MMKVASLCVCVAMATTLTSAAYSNSTMGMSGYRNMRDLQRIVGGTEVAQGTYPYFTQYRGRFLCGSSLVHEDIVIGAAHCCAPSNCGLYINSVELGEGTSVTVERFIRHPDYKVTNGGTANNDIVALKLTEPVTDITPLVYNSDPDIPADGQELTVMGFGLTEGGANRVSDEMLEVNVNVVDGDSCRDEYDDDNLDRYIKDDIHICAFQPDGGACNGDSGGPLITADTGEVVGIVSWGDLGCDEFPVIYTRVSEFSGWIDEAICCLSDNPPDSCDTTTCSEEFGKVHECVAGENSPPCPYLSLIDIAIAITQSQLCFSSDATALVEGKGKVPMKDIAVGDKVMTGSGKYETIYTISHSHPDEPTTFVRIDTDMENEEPIEITPDHLMFVMDTTNTKKKNPVLVPAKDVKVGDFVQTLLHGPQKVTEITVITKNGHYNPLTTDGTIVVDGILTSTYTSLDKEGSSYLEIGGWKTLSVQSLMEISLKPYRALCLGVSLDLCRVPSDSKNDNNRPLAISFVVQFYNFWLQQHVVVQMILFLVYIFCFGVTNLIVSNPGGLALVISCIMYYRREQKLSHMKQDSIPLQPKVAT